jgi:RNA polymerase primary sigma factor
MTKIGSQPPHLICKRILSGGLRMAYPEQYSHPSEMIGSLLEKAEVRGYLTPDDIIDQFPDGSDDLEKVGNIILILQHHGVEVVLEEEDPIASTDVDSLVLEPMLNLEHISTDDTVGLYLKEMSRVPLLSHEEISLAQRIQQAFRSNLELNKLNGKGTVNAGKSWKLHPGWSTARNT